MREIELIFTNHALERFTERSISLEEIQYSLLNFKISYPTRRGGQVIECEVGSRTLKVWFAYPINLDGSNIVLTAAWKDG